ncbi:transposase [Bacillus sp. FJAT-42376]|uniref:helix-turn-helix domain-containing protein n=1 Tax=Bacillus sp. FJAT-42376 TaxID=2014076 RepID=UPI000F4D4FCD|nr:transposase [Bacillus sp. FJAT-42376]AZB43384.1 transposase [Bacillus sp. FJAT-42376]
MVRKKIEIIEDVKKKYVRIALETGNYTSTARKAGIDRATLSGWIKEYKDEIEESMELDGHHPLSSNPTKDELQIKYEHAMKLLGEKELEVAMLRSLLKKSES